MTFTARFPSTCAACTEDITPGDSCDWTDDLVVHADCASDPVVDRTNPARHLGELCPSCFTHRAVNGSCMCEED